MLSMLQSLGILIKKNKLFYYVKHFLMLLVPRSFYEAQLKRRLKALNKYDKDVVLERVNYYNRLQSITPIGNQTISLADLKHYKKPTAYYFNAFEYTRFFSGQLRANFLFGDIDYIPAVPSIQKSRPIAGDTSNAVLLKLNRKRHFVFIKDRKPFSSKKNMLIGRSNVYQLRRMRFMELYFEHPLCDLAQVNKTGGNPKWIAPKLSITAHLDYKFILSLEGNDVATNLKWIMSSNSIAVMTRPKFESWFMEGTLIPDHHYILIKDDYSDLGEKLQYYITHEEKAQAIIRHANEYVKKFQNKKQENLVSLLVLQKYFYYTGQAEASGR